jgi:hypothetical protein
MAARNNKGTVCFTVTIEITANIIEQNGKKGYYDGVYTLYYYAVRVLPQVVSDRRLTAKARGRFQTNVCWICT